MTIITINHRALNTEEAEANGTALPILIQQDGLARMGDRADITDQQGNVVATVLYDKATNAVTIRALNVVRMAGRSFTRVTTGRTPCGGCGD